MYKIYFYYICVMSALVYGNGDDTKYIDLLPEAEKEEFLNRIARRIIQEIQSKDSPEQSHTEVSDDQLNAHDTYVQDLIKEESENLRKERSYADTERIKSRADNDKFDKDKSNDDVEPDANNQHIDLTLRGQKQAVKNERNHSDDSAVNVIPVKVVYDQENYKSTPTTRNISDLSDFTIGNSEQKDNDNAKNSNDSKSELINSTSPLVHLSEGNITTIQSSIKSTHIVTQVSEKQSDFLSDNDNQTLVSNNQTLRHGVENSTPILMNTDSLSTLSKDKGDSFENTESSTQIYVTLKQTTENKDISTTKSEDESSNIDTTIKPLTTKNSINYHSNKPENLSSAIIYVTTVKSMIDQIKNDIDVVNKLHNSGEKGEIKMKKDLRTRLDTPEYNLEKRASREKNSKEKGYKNKNIKQYFVYEVPKINSVFVKAEDKEESEQHYVVPIYNFAPENAYYNAHNRYGVNNNNEEQIVPDSIDKELFLRSGFKIDINTRKQKNKGIQFAEWIKHPLHSHWEHVLQSKLEHFPLFNDNQDNNNLKPKIKHDNNFKQIHRHKKKDDLSKIPDKIIYVPLRKHGENIHDNKGVTPKKSNKYYFDFKSPSSAENDHVKALKNFLYQQQKFGYLSPSRLHNFPRSNKRVLDYVDYDLKFENNKKQIKKPKKDIELDYYFGSRLSNKSNEGNSYEEYLDTEDTKGHQLFINADEKNSKVDLKNYRVTTMNDDCEHGCIELDLKTPFDDFVNYVEALITVLRDMIYKDRTDLVNYDWLLSTIDLRSAIKKLKDLTETIENGDKIHSLALKLLNYIVYLYNRATYKLEYTIHSNHQTKAVQDINNIVNSFLSLLRRRIILPKNKNRPGKKLTNPASFWYKHYIRVGTDSSRKDDRVLTSFKKFLNDLEDNMFELHDALKHIALITTYLNENWYKDLKNIYLKSASKKQLLQVILHLAASRLFSSIEETATRAEEDDLYKNSNGEEVRRIQDEFVFVLRILERIKKTH